MDVTASDNGVYSCRAVNPAGQLDSTDNFVLNIPGEQIRHYSISATIFHSFREFDIVHCIVHCTLYIDIDIVQEQGMTTVQARFVYSIRRSCSGVAMGWARWA